MNILNGLKSFTVIPIMLVMAIVCTVIPNPTVATAGEYWVIGIVPFSFIISSLIIKNWLDGERYYREGPTPIPLNRTVEPIEPQIMCRRCGVNEAVTKDGHCNQCDTIVIKVTEL